MNVVVVTPNEADGARRGFLREHGIDARCARFADLPLLGGDTGCVVLVEEALVEPDLHAFHAARAAQPPWSDLPLCSSSRGRAARLGAGAGLFPNRAT
jgi:hypothetical protein